MSSEPKCGEEPDPLTPHFRFRRLLYQENPDMNRELFALRFKVYCLECGFLDPKAYEDKLETDEFDSNSVHFTAHNLEKELVGSVRLVLPGLDQSFPFQAHCPQLFDDAFMPPPTESGEVSRLGPSSTENVSV